MNLQCRFYNCQWQGKSDEIFEHFELQHKKYLREPKGHLYYDFNIDDLQQETFVLCSPNSLYYFQQNLYKPRIDGIDFGVFHIADTEQTEYVLKLRQQFDNQCKYWGPFKSEKDLSQHFSVDHFYINFNFDLLQMLDMSMSSSPLRLYFGEFGDDEAELSAGLQNFIWPGLEELRFQSLLLDQFTCAVCLEFIRRNARFCENRHFVCLSCFTRMLQLKKLKCPMCRGQYLYDCSDDQIEHLLCAIKWPDESVAKVDTKTEKFIKTVSDVKYSKHLFRRNFK